MSRVSRARSGLATRLGPSARAASTSARLVMDFEPGSVTAARTGPSAGGTRQCAPVLAAGLLSMLRA